MNTFHFSNAIHANQISWPDWVEAVGLDSSALQVFTDFLVHKPLVVNYRMPARELEGSMRQQHVRLKLVVDEYETFIGLVSLDDLNGPEIIKRVALGYDRNELVVGDFMRARHTLWALDYGMLERGRTGNLLSFLQQLDQQHCLVLDRDGCRVRGLISASDIVRKLKLPLDLAEGISFMRVYRVLQTRNVAA